MATIKDIASLAQVSPATVSKVLNNDTNFSVSDSTKQRIFQVAKELNYKPRKVARSNLDDMMMTKNVVILSAVSEIDELQDLFWGSVRSNIESNCNLLGIRVSKTMRRANVNLEELHQVDGIFVLGTVNITDLIPHLSKQAQIVLVNHTFQTAKYDLVSIGFQRAVDDVIDHFLEQGHRKIGFIGGPQYLDSVNSSDGRMKLEEPLRSHFYTRMQQAGLYNEHYYRDADWSAESGYTCMKSLLEEQDRPTACFVANDPMAVGALKALQEAQVAIPEQMAIVGFDNIGVTAYLNPPLSTFNVFPDLLGKTAAQLMFERFAGRTARINSIIDPQLIVRESSLHHLT